MPDLPARSTWPSVSSVGAIDMSRSSALFLGHVVGAKYCKSCREDESSSAESLSSNGWPAEWTEPFPALTQMSPLLSTAGAAPPIQIAPWLSPAAASTVKHVGVPPASLTATP